MLRLTIEVVPWGEEHRKYKVGEIEVTNLTGLGYLADYEVRLFTVQGLARQLVDSNVVEGYNRQGSTYFATAVECAARGLEAAFNRLGWTLTTKFQHMREHRDGQTQD